METTMKAIAWAIVWVAILYVPDVRKLAGGDKIDDAMATFLVGMFLFASIMLILATLFGS
jgi:hypothetical protein